MKEKEEQSNEKKEEVETGNNHQPKNGLKYLLFAQFLLLVPT